MRRQVIERLVQYLTKSMVGYEVLGTPEGRQWVIRGMANHLYNRMTDQERRYWLDNS